MKKIFKKNYKSNIKKIIRSTKLNGKPSSFSRGNYVIISKSYGFVTWKNIELFRRAFSKLFKKLGKKDFKLIIPSINWKSFTKKPLLSRMGKGSGPINHWKAYLKDGSTLLQLSSSKSFRVVYSIWKQASRVFPLKTKFCLNY